MVGTDVIKQIVFDFQESVENSEYNKENAIEMLRSILSCLDDICNTNSFMIMTINRCIDYTKASKGMKLVPKLETIHLLDTLSMPLKCMKNVQSKISIQLNSIPPNICPYLITDRQWLQENILCLLSNAAKYSDGGTVTISIYLDSYDSETDAINGEPSGTFHNTLMYSKGSKSSQVTPMHPAEVDQHFSVSDSKEIDGRKSFISFATQSVSRFEFDKNDSERKSRFALNDAGTKTMSVENVFLRFEIEDTGIGVPEEMMSTLFNPFRQTQRLAGGTGLGLYSLAKRIEALQGKYGVSKRRDNCNGSLFWFSIPYRPDDSLSDIEEATLSQRSTDQPSPRNSAKKNVNSLSISASISRNHSKSLISRNAEAVSKPTTPISAVGNKFEARSRLEALSYQALNALNANKPTTSSNDTKLPKDLAAMSTDTAIDPGYLASLQLVAPSISKNDATPRNADVELLLAKHDGLLQHSTPSTPSVTRMKITPVDPDKSLNVLFVDDSPAMTKVSGTLLKRRGHSVVIAENGVMAVNMFEESLHGKIQAFDVVLMDLQMPVMDGMTATRRIRAMELSAERVHRVVIIGVSACSDEETMREAFKAGLDDFIPKPFTIDLFDHMIVKFAVKPVARQNQVHLSSVTASRSEGGNAQEVKNKSIVTNVKAETAVFNNLAHKDKEELTAVDLEESSTQSNATLQLNPVIKLNAVQPFNNGLIVGDVSSADDRSQGASNSASMANKISNRDSNVQDTEKSVVVPPALGQIKKESSFQSQSGLRSLENTPSSPAGRKFAAVAPNEILNVLLVDDSPAILKMSGMMIKRRGHKLTTAENGAIAVAKVKEAMMCLDGSVEPFDLVLMDLQMPVMDGPEAVRCIRALEVNTSKHLKVIGVSACSDNDIIQVALDAGLDEFMSKPFSIESFERMVTKLSIRPSSTV